MSHGYLVLASERRVLSVMFDDDSIQQTIGCSTVEHGTTFHSEDQLLTNGDELGDIAAPRFHIRGVPFSFVGNAPLVGAEQTDGRIADCPVMTIDEFRLMICFVTRAEVRRSITAIDADGV